MVGDVGYDHRSKCAIVGEKSVDIYTQGQPTRGTSYLPVRSLDDCLTLR